MVVDGPFEFEFGFGDEFREEALQPRERGVPFSVAARVRHFARYAGGTIVEVRGVGSFKTNYVAPRRSEKETAS